MLGWGCLNVQGTGTGCLRAALRLLKDHWSLILLFIGMLRKVCNREDTTRGVQCASLQDGSC